MLLILTSKTNTSLYEEVHWLVWIKFNVQTYLRSRILSTVTQCGNINKIQLQNLLTYQKLHESDFR